MSNENFKVSYTVKKTRHKYQELYRVKFSDGVQRMVGRRNDSWHYYITDSSFNTRKLEDMESAVRFAYEMAQREKEWIKTHVVYL